MKMKTQALVLAALMIALAWSTHARAAEQKSPGSGKIKHVLLLSIDGMHAVDFYNCANGIVGVNGGEPYARIWHHSTRPQLTM